MSEEAPKGPPGMSDDWLTAERKHEREMKRLELEERKRQDSMRQWRNEERRVRFFIFFGIVVAASMLVLIARIWADVSAENKRLDTEQRITCIEDGGTPVQTDAINGKNWMCLYLQKEDS